MEIEKKLSCMKELAICLLPELLMSKSLSWNVIIKHIS